MDPSGMTHRSSGPPPKIFISYRHRGEGAGYGGRIADELRGHFGPEQCFRDVKDIQYGVDFAKAIQKAISTCEFLVVVIGPDWVSQRDDHGKLRLHNPSDFVRIEVAEALKRDVRVIPALVGGAKIPLESELPADLATLCRRQAHELSDVRWEYDLRKLIEAIESAGLMDGSAQRSALRHRGTHVAVMALAIVSVVTGATWYSRTKASQEQLTPKPQTDVSPVLGPLTSRNDTKKPSLLEVDPVSPSPTPLPIRESKPVDDRTNVPDRRAQRKIEKLTKPQPQKKAALPAPPIVPVKPTASSIAGIAVVQWTIGGVVHVARLNMTGKNGMASVTGNGKTRIYDVVFAAAAEGDRHDYHIGTIGSRDLVIGMKFRDGKLGITDVQPGDASGLSVEGSFRVAP